MRSTQEAKSMRSRPCVLWFSMVLIVGQFAASRLSLAAQGGQAAPAESAQAAGGSYTPTAANLASRQAFQDAKFGLFIHWGVYSVLGDGEWVMNNKKMPTTKNCRPSSTPRRSTPPNGLVWPRRRA